MPQQIFIDIIKNGESTRIECNFFIIHPVSYYF